MNKSQTRYEFNITPVAKPRMTQRDKWKKRPVVNKYYAFKDTVNLIANRLKYKVEPILSIDFHIPMPKSWSKKKRIEMKGKPHQQKPDLDNLIKAWKDCLCKEDSFVWSYKDCNKYWSETGKIIVRD